MKHRVLVTPAIRSLSVIWYRNHWWFLAKIKTQYYALHWNRNNVKTAFSVRFACWN